MKKVNKRNPQSEYVEEDLAEDIKLDGRVSQKKFNLS